MIFLKNLNKLRVVGKNDRDQETDDQSKAPGSDDGLSQNTQETDPSGMPSFVLDAEGLSESDRKGLALLNSAVINSKIKVTDLENMFYIYMDKLRDIDPDFWKEVKHHSESNQSFYSDMIRAVREGFVISCYRRYLDNPDLADAYIEVAPVPEQIFSDEYKKVRNDFFQINQ